MPRYRITFDVSQRSRIVINAASEAAARLKVRDATRGDEMPGQINPQDTLDSEVTHVDTRRRIINVVAL